MAFEMKNMNGSLFKNEDRDAEKNQPHYTGSCKINDDEFWISAWVKQSSSGKKYVSMSFKSKELGWANNTVDADLFDEDVNF